MYSYLLEDHPPVALLLLVPAVVLEVEALYVLHHRLDLSPIGPVVDQDLGVITAMG